MQYSIRFRRRLKRFTPPPPLPVVESMREPSLGDDDRPTLPAPDRVW